MCVFVKQSTQQYITREKKTTAENSAKQQQSFLKSKLSCWCILLQVKTSRAELCSVSGDKIIAGDAKDSV